MILWFVVGFIVWILCILFMLAIFKGGNIARGKKQKPYFRDMGKTGNVGNSIRGVTKDTTSVLYS